MIFSDGNFLDLEYLASETVGTDKEKYMAVARELAKNGTCNRLQVGAIIVNKYGRIVGAGWNTSPKGIPTCKEVGCRKNEEGRCYATVHAEQESILSVLNKNDLIDSTIYVTHYPCENCSKLILESGIKKVVYGKPYENKLSSFFLQHVQTERLEG